MLPVFSRHTVCTSRASMSLQPCLGGLGPSYTAIHMPSHLPPRAMFLRHSTSSAAAAQPRRIRVAEHIAALPGSPTLGAMDLARQAELAGREVYKLGFGESPFPVPQTIVNELKERASQNSYETAAGVEALRQAVAHYHTARGLPTAAQNIVVGPGSKELMFQLQMVVPSDLLLPAPSWVSYFPQAKMLGRAVHYLDTKEEHGWKLRAETLGAFLSEQPVDRQRILVINSPNNPTGAAYSRQEIADLAAVCREHGILVLSDEIYSDLMFDHMAHVPFATEYPEATITSSGISKFLGAGGWRLGHLVIPDELAHVRTSLLRVASSTFSAVSAPVQYAAIKGYMGSDDIETYLKHSKVLLSAIAARLHKQLNAAHITCPPTDGGFYLFPNWEAHRSALARLGVTTGEELTAHLLEKTGVALLPGSAFGMPSESLTQRLAFVDYDGASALTKAADRDLSGALTEEQCHEFAPRVLKAIELLCDHAKAL